jgi:hypothetical protein
MRSGVDRHLETTCHPTLQNQMPILCRAAGQGKATDAVDAVFPNTSNRANVAVWRRKFTPAQSGAIQPTQRGTLLRRQQAFIAKKHTGFA